MNLAWFAATGNSMRGAPMWTAVTGSTPGRPHSLTGLATGVNPAPARLPA